MVRSTWILVPGLIALASPLAAQRPRTGDVDRPALERRFQERMGAVMRQRLNLNDEQARKLQDLNGRFDQRRRDLFKEEREVRVGLRRAIQGDSASNDEVASLMDRALRLQRQRLDLMEAEQKELSTFMTPIQRAKYVGFLEQVRSRMDDMRRRREEGGPPGEGFGPPPRRRPMRPPA